MKPDKRSLVLLLINILFAYPSDPKVTNPSRLRLYFEYGRSTEGQLSRMTRADRTRTAPITLSGWYDPLEVWRGWAEGSIEGAIDDQQWMENRIDRAVTQILAKLPRL